MDEQRRNSKSYLWGAGGREFKSRRPDQRIQWVTENTPWPIFFWVHSGVHKAFSDPQFVADRTCTNIAPALFAHVAAEQRPPLTTWHGKVWNVARDGPRI